MLIWFTIFFRSAHCFGIFSSTHEIIRETECPQKKKGREDKVKNRNGSIQEEGSQEVRKQRREEGKEIEDEDEDEKERNRRL